MQLTDLNQRQLAAVKQIEGPLLILAGAGSGKTRVLTYRIAHLIDNHHVPANRILALTFTNKAAKEMQDRVLQRAGRRANGVWMGTFHAICLRFLRRDSQAIGYAANFVIYDTADQREVIKSAMKTLRISDKDLSIYFVKSEISDAKNKQIDDKRYSDLHKDDFKRKQVAKIYSLYQTSLRQNNAMDFDDLIINTLQLFAQAPAVLQYYQEKFQYIHVDEYQDTNYVQYLLIKKLSERNRNICVVGDGDQSIYSWRGADIRNIRDFASDFPGAKVIKLEQNYRSSQRILQLANSVIKNNADRHEKKLWTENQQGDLIDYYCARDGDDEARFVANQIIKAVDEGASYSDFAVLYRTNAQSRSFENIFNRVAIPYKIIGGHKFYERLEIKDLMAYLRFIVNPSDDIALRRIINVPKRGIGTKTLDRLQAIAATQHASLYEALRTALQGDRLSARALSKLASFENFIGPLVAENDTIKGSQALDKILTASGYRALLEDEGTPQANARLENIEELQNQLSEYEQKHDKATLNDFLQEVSLLSDQDQIEDRARGEVLLMTIHAAKGLEFDSVFLVGLEENLFPSRMALESDSGLDEERRLCYVAITRARKQLAISHATMRMRFGKLAVNDPSRFIAEMPLEHIHSHSGDIRRAKSGNSALRQKYQRYIKPSAYDAVCDQQFSAGMRVRHNVFGDGLVITVKNDDILTIAFDKKGIKHLDKHLAPLQIIEKKGAQ